MDTQSIALAGLMFLAAILYSSVGHAGASGYLAAMALFGVAPAVMKPTALALNILVATIAAVKFHRAGAFSWPLLGPLVLASVPMAWLGGTLTLPGHWYKPLVGAVLIYAAWAMFRRSRSDTSMLPVRAPPTAALVAIGAGIGLLSGLTGVGGGIFLSPLLLAMRWAEVRVVSGVAAAFILLNSIAGLAGVMQKSVMLPPALPLWAVVVIAGGFIGAELGSRRLAAPIIQRLLALVLVIAGAKMMSGV